MTLDQSFAANQGQSLLIPGGGEANRGQCVMWADTVYHDVYNLSYVYANAIDWWNNADNLSITKSFDKITDGSIKKGDIVVFNQKVGSVYGHIDVAMEDGTFNQFLGADSNWGGNKTVHLVNHIGAGYIIGALRSKSATQGDEPMVDAAHLNSLTQSYFGRAASDEEVKRYCNIPNVTLARPIEDFDQSAEYKAKQAADADAYNWKNHAVNDLVPENETLKKDSVLLAKGNYRVE